MSQTAPTGITASPATPDRADRSTFSSRATAWADWLKNQAVPEISAVEQNVYNNAVDAYNNAVAALNSAGDAASSAIDAQNSVTAAQNVAAAAAASIGATMWAAGTFAVGNVVWSPMDNLIYICKLAGVSSIDPSLDGTRWRPAIAPNANAIAAIYTQQTFGGI